MESFIIIIIIITCIIIIIIIIKNIFFIMKNLTDFRETVETSNGCIVEHEVPPFCVNPLTVAEGKKLRLVVDLRHVNNYLVKPKFKHEDLRSLSQVLDEGHWFFTWDLKSGYHHVDICLDHQKYLGFAWPFSGVVRYFTFTVLSFGLSSACFCFTKLMCPLVKRCALA